MKKQKKSPYNDHFDMLETNVYTSILNSANPTIATYTTIQDKV